MSRPASSWSLYLRPARRGGFSIIEALVGIIIVGVTFAAVMTTVGAARTVQYKAAGRERGTYLADHLMAEILAQRYQDPQYPGGPLGREAGESSSPRLNYDDVDDYDGWQASPPQQADGTVMTSLPGWSEEVEVRWVDPADLASTAIIDTGVKRILVTVSHNGVPMARLVAVAAAAFPEFDE